MRLTRLRTASASVDHVVPRHAPIRRRAQQRASTRTAVVARPVRPEQAVDGAGGHLKVDAGQLPLSPNDRVSPSASMPGRWRVYS